MSVTAFANESNGPNDPVAPFKVHGDFPGGNVVVERIEGRQVFLHQDTSDTSSDRWFYWYFGVNHGASQEITFHFTRNNVFGREGPAFSFDGGKSWDWLGRNAVKNQSFSVSIPEGVEDARFAFTIPYTAENLEHFLKSLPTDSTIEKSVLCQSNGDRDVELLRLGRLDGKNPFTIFLTARHHACETLASYVVEGIVQGVLEDSPSGTWLQNNVEILIVPFVDKDGVQQGFQGKNRIPHDHNRDYNEESIYNTVRAIRDLVTAEVEGRTGLVLDIHCPGRKETTIYFAGPSVEAAEREAQKFAETLESTQEGPLRYTGEDDVPFGVGWNRAANYGGKQSFANWAARQPNVQFATIMEVSYARIGQEVITPQKLRLFGQDIAKAFALFARENTD